ncbi:pentapeptide repeat-containing protein [Scytonema millei]|uniref:Helix-turn-helix domain-containing protein n=1 Tax=Scytonema millei VB511283 TaxID=1245923 RepID=A0A9X5E313_9CYAN|nr:pentapeptide repeat-containing protein [Scytonema millei]NHC34301.1 helix-turn-helix domain-containing protein [Scytonema millei VB511283]
MPSFQASSKSFPELIRKAREASHLSQAAFGKLFSPPVTQPTVARWEKGEILPDRRHFPKIASLLSLTLEQLFDYIEGRITEINDLSEPPVLATLNKMHLAILNRGAVDWNRWREKNPEIFPQLVGAKPKELNLDGIDLREADLRDVDFSAKSLRNARLDATDLRGANLVEADLRNADLRGANLREANLTKANLSNANLEGADLFRATIKNADFMSANLKKANLSKVVFRDARLCDANLEDANLSKSILIFVDLRGAILNRANFEKAIIKGGLVDGISTWDINLNGAIQEYLHISSVNGNSVYVNDLRLAYIKHLALQHNEDGEIQSIINQLQQTLEKKTIKDRSSNFIDTNSQVVASERRRLLSKVDLSTDLILDRENPMSLFFDEFGRRFSSIKNWFVSTILLPVKMLADNDFFDGGFLDIEDCNYDDSEDTEPKPPSPDDAGFIHPAIIKYSQENGPFVYLGLQDHDFIKINYERCTGHKEPSWENLHGISVYVHSNDKPTRLKDGSIDDEALTATGQSIKWYKDPNEAFADFKNRMESFQGSINQVNVYSGIQELKERIEKALCEPQIDLEGAINFYISSTPRQHILKTIALELINKTE